MDIQVKAKPQLDTSMVDQIRDTTRKAMHSKFKRVYNLNVACIHCNKTTVLANTTLGFCCKYCGKYNNAEKAKANYDAGNGIEPVDNSIGGFPAIKSMDNGKREYNNMRDEMEIRADMFVNGKTRDSMGLNKFNRTLKKELIKNKCYRSEEKVGI